MDLGPVKPMKPSLAEMARLYTEHGCLQMAVRLKKRRRKKERKKTKKGVWARSHAK